MTTIINPLARRLVPTLGRGSGPLLVLRFVGRRSGRSYAIPAIGHRIDNSTVVLTDAGWAINFQGGHPVTVLGGARPVTGHALLLENTGEAADAIRRVLAVRGPRALGLRIQHGHQPTDAELVAVRRVIRLP